MLKNEVEVSVVCITYNHKNFLRRCLDNIICQKTDFKFEVLVHDDCSTDGTTDIVREYAQKYPDLIVPIYEQENQYSKGVKITANVVRMATGKYIALCEGDDYWCDDKKLQLQYDYMEEHPYCSACFHNTRIYNSIINTTSFENNWKDIHVMTAKEVFKMGNVHTSSYFFRRQFFNIPDYGKNVWIQDFVFKTTLFKYGQVVVLPRIMSVYNINNGSGSVTNYFFRIAETDMVKRKTEEIENYLIKYKQEKNEYSDVINELLFQIEFCKIYNYNYRIMSKTNDKKEFKKLKQEIIRHGYFKKFVRRFNLIGKFRQFVKFNLPFCLFKRLMLKRKSNLIWIE